jgi:transposase
MLPPRSRSLRLLTRDSRSGEFEIDNWSPGPINTSASDRGISSGYVQKPATRRPLRMYVRQKEAVLAIAQRAPTHLDFALFRALPGAGPVFAPRLLVAFGEQRERYPSAIELQQYAGIAPVTERSGSMCWVHWRLQCPKFLRQTFVGWASESIRHPFWARAYYAQQRAKGHTHYAATRALAFTWLRVP